MFMLFLDLSVPPAASLRFRALDSLSLLRFPHIILWSFVIHLVGILDTVELYHLFDFRALENSSFT